MKDRGEFYSKKSGGISFVFKKPEKPAPQLSLDSPEGWIVVKETETFNDQSNFGKMAIALKADPIISEIDECIKKSRLPKDI